MIQTLHSSLEEVTGMAKTVIERRNLSKGLELIAHYCSHQRAHDFCAQNTSNVKTHEFLHKWFGKVRAKAVPMAAQVERIRALAVAQGYDDVLALLDEKIECIETDPDDQSRTAKA